MTLPLHAVLRQQPPTIIVSALIAAYPKAVSTKCDGELPLHVALHHGASLDVIQNLIVAYPKALNEPNYMKKKPIDVFEENEKLWLNEEEKNAIDRLLTDGIENIVVEDYGDSNKTSQGNEKSDSEKEDPLATTLREEGWLKVSSSSAYLVNIICCHIFPNILLFHITNYSRQD